MSERGIPSLRSSPEPISKMMMNSGRDYKNLQKVTAKTEFLLRSLLAFYSNTVKNTKAKDHPFDDAVRKLKEYIPLRQKGR